MCSATGSNSPPAPPTVAGGLLGATAADLFMPLFSGQLVDALTQGASDPAARRAAIDRVRRHRGAGRAVDGAAADRAAGDRAVHAEDHVGRVAADAFHRVQRFSTDWHANSFAGSTVRKVTRGMWALDLLNDTLLVALFPSMVMLLGSTILLGGTGP